MRYLWLLISCALLATATPVRANLVLGIAEGISEQSRFGDIEDRYQLFADYLGRVLKNRVTLEASQNFKNSATNLQKGRYDLFFSRPSNVPAKAIRDHQYQLIVVAKGDSTANFIVRKDHGFKKPEDILTRTVAMPRSSTALMTEAGLATIRDMGGMKGPNQLRYANYQEAVGYMVEMKFADVGIVNPGQAKAWEKKGGVVLFKSKKLPFWSITASSKLGKAELTKLQTALVDMENTDEGKKALAKIGVKGWVIGNPKEFLDMLTWLGV